MSSNPQGSGLPDLAEASDGGTTRNRRRAALGSSAVAGSPGLVPNTSRRTDIVFPTAVAGGDRLMDGAAGASASSMALGGLAGVAPDVAGGTSATGSAVALGPLIMADLTETPAASLSLCSVSAQATLCLRPAGADVTSCTSPARTVPSTDRLNAVKTRMQETAANAMVESSGGAVDWPGANSNAVAIVSHLNDAFATFNELRQSQELCDVILNVNGRRVAAHRIVLAAASPYFRAMFTASMRESRQDEIVLNDVEVRCVEALVDFAYTGWIMIGEGNVQQLLPTASLFQMAAICDACCAFLRLQLDYSNCLGIAQFADTHGCVDLRAEAEQFAREHFAVIASKCDEFLDLAADRLCSLLASSELNVQSEEGLVTDVLRWVRHDSDQRRQCFADMLGKIRLILLPPAALVKLSMEPEVRRCERCRDMVDEAKNCLLVPECRSRIPADLAQPRQPSRNAVLYSVGGWCTGEALADAERYDWPNDEWTSIASMSKKRCGVGLAAVGPYLYALGGHDGTHYLHSIERYDPRSNAWTACAVSPNCEVRTSVGIGVIGEYIYAVGGQDGTSCLDMTECYNTRTGQWTRKAPMSERRLGVAVVVLNNLLYAIGGADGGVVPLRSAERYDPARDQWEAIAPMLTKRKHHGAAPLNNCIYVAGGRDEHSELNTVECYNPVTNSWSQLAHMTSYRSGVGLSVVNNRIFAVGGFNGTTYLRSVEYLDNDRAAAGEHERWTEVASMNNRRLGGGVAVIQSAFSAPAPSPLITPMPGLS